MDALYLDRGQPIFRRDLPRPVPGKGEALIRVTLAGICATDLELNKGYAGGFTGVLGHEFVGVVEEAADASWTGRRVTGTINLGCQRCEYCLAGVREHCRNRTVLGIIQKDGGFAEYLTLPVQNLVPISDSLPDETAVFTEPLAAALRIREQVVVSPGKPAAVVGPGRLGLLVARSLALAGTPVVVFGRSASSLELPRRWGLETALVSEIDDSRFDFVVEVTGNPAGLAASLRLVRPLGTLILKSTFADPGVVDLTKIVVDEIHVVGSRCGPFSPALRLLEAGVVPVWDLIDGRYPLSEALEALNHASRPGVRKILLVP